MHQSAEGGENLSHKAFFVAGKSLPEMLRLLEMCAIV
jgi:hypothetical protein